MTVPISNSRSSGKKPNFDPKPRKTRNDSSYQLVDYAIELGVEQGFIQEGETASESFIPEFNGEGV